MKPIHFASTQGSISTFKVLTKLGSDPRSLTCKVSMKNSFLLGISGYAYMHVHLFLYRLEDSPFIVHVLKVTCHW